jgi:hypothetical protein
MLLTLYRTAPPHFPTKKYLAKYFHSAHGEKPCSNPLTVFRDFVFQVSRCQEISGSFLVDCTDARNPLDSVIFQSTAQ